jgi:transposase
LARPSSIGPSSISVFAKEVKMARRRIDVLDIRELIRRVTAGETDRRIARELGQSRNTVAKYRSWAEKEGFLEAEELPPAKELAGRLANSSAKKPGPPSCVEPYAEFVKEKRAAGVELKALHRLLVERGYTRSYSSLRRFVAVLEEKEPKKFLRVETPRGEEAQVDFGYVGKIFDENLGRPRKAWVFVMTLSWSRHQYSEIVFDQRVETWLALHVRAFTELGGVVTRVVIDNLKAAITRAVIHDAEAQRSYRELAEHYGFLISPCRPRTPRHKGKVESGVRYVKRNALAGRTFRNLEEANAHLRRWVMEVAGRRDHGTTHEEPLVRFEEEKAALSPLPPQHYELSAWKGAKVHPDCHVVFNYSFYSAPHRLVGKQVWLRATMTRVELYFEHERVTSHRRAQRRGEWVTNVAHYPPEKVHGLLPEPVRVHEQAQRVGPRTGELVERLLGERPLDRLRGAQGVVRLAKRFGQERLEAACARALRFDQPRYIVVKSILEKGLEEDESAELLGTPSPLPKTSRFARTAEELALTS